MNNKDFYQKTFSQITPSYTVKWEDFAQMKWNAKRRSLRLFVTVAAAVLLFGALSVTAMATNIFGLRDLLLPQKQEVSVIDPDTGVIIPDQTEMVDTVSLSGYTTSKEYLALAEWQAFLSGYDQDRAILNQIGNNLDPALEKYIFYFVYTQEMADKLDEIAAKYDLKLYADQIDLSLHPQALGSLAEFAKDSGMTQWTYLYDDGTCHFDGSAYLEDMGLVNLQFQRAIKGTFHEVFLNVGDVAQYQQWNYKTSSGVEILLAMGPEKSVIFVDLPDCFASFNVFSGTENGMTAKRLEAVAERYDFSKLSPVERVPLID